MSRTLRRAGILGAAFGVALAAVVLACSSSNSPSAAASCTSLAACCVNLPTTEGTSCTSVAAAEDGEACSSLLATYNAAGTCALTILHLDGGSPVPDATAGGGCSALSACCSKLPAAEQTGCQAEVTTGTAVTCTTALQGYQLAGLCGGQMAKPDSGAGDTGVALSGPSCPAGKPPQTFVGADAGADCLKCQANCLSTEGWASDCDSYYECYCPCAAGDMGCQQACAPLEGDCTDTTTDVENCIAQDCSSLCPMPAHTGCMGDAGVTDYAACESCADTSCQSQQSAYMLDCPDYPACISTCDCTDESCLMTCATASSTCENAVFAFSQCLSQGSCPAGCSGALTGINFP